MRRANAAPQARPLGPHRRRAAVPGALTWPRLPAPAAPAGSEVVVEEFLDGEEASFFALLDGESAVALASAQDHKAVGDGDTGGWQRRGWGRGHERERAREEGREQPGAAAQRARAEAAAG
jgi:hypothetical protein